MGCLALLLALQPVVDQVVQHRQRHRAGAHHRGVEAAVLEVRAQGLFGALAQLAQLEVAVRDLRASRQQAEGERDGIEAGVAAGAFTGWLSGSGSSVLCVCRAAVTAAVGAAMQAELRARISPQGPDSIGERPPVGSGGASAPIPRRSSR